MPVLLAFIAGTVDACTFIALFGLFVAQVTGSFVLVGVSAISGHSAAIGRLFAIPVFFLAGVAAVFLAEAARRPARALAVTLAAEGVLVACFVATGMAGEPFHSANTPLAIAASLFGVAAMGVQSALVRLLLHAASSTNVMTTNTTQAAIDVAHWLLAVMRNEDRTEAARRIAALAPVLAGFFAGTAAGAVGFQVAGFRCLLVSIAAIAGMIVWAVRAGRPASRRESGPIIS